VKKILVALALAVLGSAEAFFEMIYIGLAPRKK